MDLQTLNIGDVVMWHGIQLTVVDFHCYLSPLFHSSYGKIYATPEFKKQDGTQLTIHEAYWKEVIAYEAKEI